MNRVARLVGGVVLFVLVVAALVSVFDTPEAGLALPEGKSLPRVRYAWDGTARSVDITLIGADGKTELRENESVPGYVEFTSSRGQFLYVSIESHGKDSVVACTIVVDGVMVRNESDEGRNTLAACGGTIPYDW